MSKSIDLTQTGGFPLTQNQLNYLQGAWNEQIAALCARGLNGQVAVLLNGCGISIVVGTGGSIQYTIAAGWIYYNGQLVRVPGSIATINTATQALYIQLNTSAGPLTYRDSTVKNVLLETTASVVGMPIGTANSPTLFARTGLGTWYATDPAVTAAIGALQGQIATLISEVNALMATPPWAELALSTGWTAVGGSTPQYRKHADGRVELQGKVQASPSAAAAVICTMPAGYLPEQDETLVCYLVNIGGGVEYTKGILISSAGGFIGLSDHSIPVTTGWQVDLSAITFPTV